MVERLIQNNKTIYYNKGSPCEYFKTWGRCRFWPFLAGSLVDMVAIVLWMMAYFCVRCRWWRDRKIASHRVLGISDILSVQLQFKRFLNKTPCYHQEFFQLPNVRKSVFQKIYLLICLLQQRLLFLPNLKIFNEKPKFLCRKNVSRPDHRIKVLQINWNPSFPDFQKRPIFVQEM